MPDETTSAAVVAMFVGSSKGEPMQRRNEIRILADGIEGDRYEAGTGTFSNSNLTDGRAVTLIDEADLLWLRDQHGLDLTDGQHRRNLVLRGLDFGKLLHARLQIGDAVLRVNRTCPPCGRLSNLLGIDAEILLKGRGGLRCDVVKPGTVTRMPGDHGPVVVRTS